MTRAFSTFTSKIGPSVLGCPPPVITDYVRDTAIRVCERSFYWRERMTSISLTNGTHEYDYTPPAGSAVHAVLRAQVDDVPVPIISISEALEKFPEWDSTPVGKPRYICQVDANTVAVFPPPDTDGPYPLELFVVLKPTRTATTMPQIVLDELEDVIVHGVLQHLLVMPNVSWTDRELAAYHAKQYLFHLTMTRNRADYGDTRRSLNARMQPFE